MITSSSKKIILPVAIGLWYLSSALCNSTTKHLLGSLTPFVISFLQFFIAWICSNVVLCIQDRRLTPVYPTFQTTQQQILVLKLSMAFTFGFVFINMGFHVMHVSIGETLRAAEPAFSILLVHLWFPDIQISRKRKVALVPVVFGIALSSYSNKDFCFQGLALATAANIAFAYRSIVTKELKSRYGMDHIDIVYFTLRYGCFLQGAAVLSVYLYHPQFFAQHPPSSWSSGLILLNGVCFYSYNQLSFFVLENSHLLTHSIANAFRRVASILFAASYFKLFLSPLNLVGMFIACSGVLIYSHVTSSELEETQAESPSEYKTNAKKEELV